MTISVTVATKSTASIDVMATHSRSLEVNAHPILAQLAMRYRTRPQPALEARVAGAPSSATLGTRLQALTTVSPQGRSPVGAVYQYRAPVD